MKTITNTEFEFLTSVNHQDKVFVFAIKQEGNNCANIYYSVQDPEFVSKAEKIEKADPSDGISTPKEEEVSQEHWTMFEPLGFPTWIRPVGMRLGAYQVERFNDKEEQSSAAYTLADNFVVSSDEKAITIFRKVSHNRIAEDASSEKYRIFADQFVYNAETNRLVNVEEVRYMRSQDADVPASQTDSFSASDPNGKAFVAPTAEIDLDLDSDFKFTVQYVPAVGTNYKGIWHFFIVKNGTTQVKIYSIARSKSCLFDSSFRDIDQYMSHGYNTLNLSINASEIYELGTSLFFQQEKIVTQSGEITSVKRGTNLMLVVNHTINTHKTATSFDLDVGMDGQLAGMNQQDGEVKTYQIHSSGIRFYGTALKLDGQSDFVHSNEIARRGEANNPSENNPNCIENGLTVGLWVNMANDYSMPFQRNLWQLTNVELNNHSAGYSSCNIYANYDHLGRFTIEIPEENKVIRFLSVPSINFNTWNYISLQFPSKDAHSQVVILEINQLRYFSSGGFGLRLKDTHNSQLIIGENSKNASGTPNLGSRFKGLLSETRLWFTFGQDLSLPYQGLTGTQESLVLCEPFSQGAGKTTSRSTYPLAASISPNVVIGFHLVGAQWISSIIPSRQNSNTVYYDANLLKCKVALIKNEELQGTNSSCEVQSTEKPVLLASADGILRLYYHRSGTTHLNRIGVAHFDSSISRFQVAYYWETDEPAHALILPKLIFSALDPGTDMNDASIAIADDPGEADCIRVSFSKHFQGPNMNAYTLSEEWTKIPYQKADGKALTVLDVVNIINGKAQDFYDYDANFTREGNYLSEANLARVGSILFQADSLPKENEDVLEAFPKFTSYALETALKKRQTFGVDSSWVLDPVLPALFLDGNHNSYIDIDHDYAPALSDHFSLETWISVKSLSNMAHTHEGIYHSMGDLAFSLDYSTDGKLYITKQAEKPNGRKIQLATNSAQLQASTWEHLAMTYKSGYALNFKDQRYVDIKDEKSFAIENALTVEAWYFMPEEGVEEGTQVVLSKYDKDQDDMSWKLYVLDKEKLGFKLVDEEGNVFNVNSKTTNSSGVLDSDVIVEMEANHWNHLAARYLKPTKQSMLFFDGAKDVHFKFPALKESWMDKMTIEFETAISDQTEDDDSTFIAFRYLNKSAGSYTNAISIQQDKRPANLHKLMIKVQDVIVPLMDLDGGIFSYDFEPDKLVRISVTIDSSAGPVALQLYIDGKLCATGTSTQTMSDTMKTDAASGDWLIGAATAFASSSKNEQHHFAGYLSDFRIWDTIRTTKQIIDHLDVDVKKDADGLVALFPMNQLPLVNTNDSSKETFITNIVTNETCKANKGGAVWQMKSIEGKIDLLINGIAVSTSIKIKKPEGDGYSASETATNADVQNSIRLSKANINIGRQISESGYNYVEGQLDNVRIWRKYRQTSQIDYYQYHDLGEGEKTDKNAESIYDLVASWTFDEGKGGIVLDHGGLHEGKIIGFNVKPDEEENSTSNDLWIPSNFNGDFSLYKNAKRVPLFKNDEEILLLSGLHKAFVGYNSTGLYIGELRLWSKVLKQSMIQSRKNKALSGEESGLEAYWPISDGSGIFVEDLSRNRVRGKIRVNGENFETINNLWRDPESNYSIDYAIPITNDTLSAINVSTDFASQEADEIVINDNVAVAEFDNLERFFLGYLSHSNNNLNLESEFSDEELVKVFIGQVQYNPKIVGFIEGAPPVPSENLSVDSPINPDKYVGTATVALSLETESTRTAAESTGRQINFDHNTHIGVSIESELKFSAGSPFLLKSVKLMKMEGEVYGDLNMNGSRANTDEKEVSGTTTESEEHSLTLGGSWEPNIYNIANVASNQLYIQAPRLYRPNNMAVAVVKSRTADLYALQSKKTKRTVDYVHELDPNIPEDTNYIMFKINPDYVKNGSLDGHIGFDNDNQYPDLEANPSQKASYYRVEEAYQLQTQIEREQEEWKNTIKQLSGASLDFVKRTQGLNLANNYVWTADGGFLCESKQVMGSYQEKHDFSRDSEIGLRLGADLKLIMGTSSFLIGPNLKGDVFLSSGSSYSKTVEDSNNASFSLNVDVEGEGFLSMQANKFDCGEFDIILSETALLGAIESLNHGYPIPYAEDVNSFYQKLLGHQMIVELNGDASPPKVEKYLILKTGETTWNWANSGQEYTVKLEDGKLNFSNRLEVHDGQYPIRYQSDNCQGKVAGYRFKSFYLHPDKENFDVLANGYDNVPLIDPTWLSDDKNPDAQAMREALGNTNSIWRIFHRVTYVNRVPPHDAYPTQSVADKSYAKGQSEWEDFNDQLFQKPDANSIANNYLLIKTILGNAGGGYIPIDTTAAISYDDLKSNINKWIDAHTTIYQLSTLEKERLYNLMLNYFRAYLLQDPTVVEKPADADVGETQVIICVKPSIEE